MKVQRAIRWLLDELPGLVNDGVVSADTAAALRVHYEPRLGVRRNVALVVTSVIGAVLVGAGIILLFAHNWSALSRGVRTVLALAPLAAVQALGAWGIWRGKTSTAWREGVGALIFLLVASAIALVGQTYHVPGDLGGFLMAWMLLALPLIYVLDVSLVALGYMAGIVAWAGYAQESGGHALPFWGLLALVLPHMWLVFKRDPASPRVALEGWMLAGCLTVAVGVVMEKCLPGLWIIVYAGLFGTFYLVGTYWMAHRDAPGFFSNPFRSIGACGVAVLALLLTFEWPWHDVGWGYWRHYGRFHEWAAIPDYIAATVLPLLALGMTVTGVRRRRPWEMAFGASPLVAVLAYCLTTAAGEAWPGMVVYNVYALILGIAALVIGIRRGRVAMVNGGSVILAVLIIARFFDVDLSFVSRGIAFILLGLAFLAVNLVVMRRKKRRAAAEVTS